MRAWDKIYLAVTVALIIATVWLLYAGFVEWPADKERMMNETLLYRSCQIPGAVPMFNPTEAMGR
jgi:uncharacterized protein involved in cysteine biosynthesis